MVGVGKTDLIAVLNVVGNLGLGTLFFLWFLVLTMLKRISVFVVMMPNLFLFERITRVFC